MIKNQRSLEYSRLCQDLNFLNDPNENQFYKTLTNANNVKITTETDLSALVTQRDKIVAEYRKLRELFDSDKQELDSLTRRKTKIPEKISKSEN